MLDRLRAITEKRTAPGSWHTAYNDDVWQSVSSADGLGDIIDALAEPTDAAAIVAMDHTYEALLAVAEAARAYSPERDHDWRCEYRTAEAGWQPGDSPVIRCECGYDELHDALAALDARIAEVTK